MVPIIVEITFRRLLNNRIELLLAFVVPVLFFSIFALIFSRGIGSAPSVKTLVVDADRSELSARVVESLTAQEGLRCRVVDGRADDAESLAEGEVASGRTTAVVLLPAGFADAVQSGTNPPPSTILIDSANPVAQPVVQALLLQAIGETIAANAAAAVTPIDLDGTAEPPTESEPDALVISRDVVGGEQPGAIVSSYAAGIAVLFLLFSAAGTGGSLLEEQEAGTLERLLTSQLSVSQLLLGKWVAIVLLGVVQVTVMFIWAHYVFGVDLWSHAGGFAAMTLATTAAAGSFALLLATLCRSRSQLAGVSTILILTMSALGGSMVPRYLMSESMQSAGLATFNAWALDGYQKVFWYDQPVGSLQPQLLVLTCASLAMLIVARRLAGRWEFG